jgi:recombinational DNA repair ATPase RecF
VSEVIRSIQFKHFRGLPDNELKLNGKSLVLLGSNGKGKSSVVDGIEFLFSGQVSRFFGAGTGGIKHDDVIPHVKKNGETKVSAFLNPSNGQISRSLNSKKTTITDRDDVKDYLKQHSGTDTFILRRAKILEFICDQDADRYQKFIQLLGISHIDNLQRCFVDAERELKDREQRALTELSIKLAVFRNPVESFEPKTLKDVFISTSDSVHSFGLEKLEQWADAAIRLPLLKAMRPEENKDKIDAFTRALVSLETPLPLNIEGDILIANRLRLKLIELKSSSIDAPKNNIISTGYDYLKKHDSEENCPLCEKPFSKPISEVLARLKKRSDSLRELRDAIANRQTSITRIQNYAENLSAQLRKDLEHAYIIGSATKKSLRNALASTLCLQRLIKRVESIGENIDLDIPDNIASIPAIRSACVASLKAQKTALVPKDSSKLEAAIALLEKGIASYESISSAEDTITSAAELLHRATIAKTAFFNARESAIQKIFDQIADTVLDYYRRLHDCNENEKSECTDLELKPTKRAATGGIRLAIQFLGFANSKDPRAFLSDGHLDSLGLCLFLATVRLFHSPGTLLVLDDVLTSIDKEHRMRVGELLFQDFDDFQIILTTHDEHWYELLESSASAWGRQEKWKFVKVKGWSVDSGPTLSEIDGSWKFIDAHLTEEDYRELGGSFRLILEDFLKRVATKLEVKVRYKIDGKYTSGDFVFAGIHDVIRDKLIVVEPESEKAICTDVGRVFGQGDLINFLSHDNPGRLEVTFGQARDFVKGVRELTKRCEVHKLIKGRQ